MTDKTIRELQSSLPWTGHYHRDFRAAPMTHKDLGHALLHIHKAGGKLAAMVNDAEHGGVDWADLAVRTEVAKYAADFVICALRIANTCPEGVIDLQRAVEDRILNKNNQLAAEATIHKGSEREGTRSVPHHSSLPKDCSSGHKPDDNNHHCVRCGILLQYSHGLHVHDPRSARAKGPQQ